MNFKNTFVLNNYMLQSFYFLFNLFKKDNICTDRYSNLAVRPHELPQHEDTHGTTAKIKE